MICTNSYKYSVVVILQQHVKKMSKSFTVLMLCNSGDEFEEVAKNLVDIEHMSVKPYMCQLMKELFRPEGVTKHAVVKVHGKLIRYICEEELKIDANQIIEDYQKRQLPRYR